MSIYIIIGLLLVLFILAIVFKDKASEKLRNGLSIVAVVILIADGIVNQEHKYIAFVFAFLFLAQFLRKLRR
ncbi:MAG: hypothetical protein ACOYOT_13455 [Bacteroidales bacterium]